MVLKQERISNTSMRPRLNAQKRGADLSASFTGNPISRDNSDMKKSLIIVLTLATIAVLSTFGVNAQQVSDANRQKVAENFKKADANGDGMLTRGEFEKLIQLNAQANLGQAAQIVRFGRYDMAFNRVDADRNGLLTPQELQALAK
jgi:hypothetical protein